MRDRNTYRIRLRGQVSEDDLNAVSPFHVTVVRAGEESSALSVCTDQSGIVGLLRHLHGLGFVFLSVIRTGCERD